MMKTFINIHTHQKNNPNEIAIYNADISEEFTVNSYFSIGIHPWFILQKSLPEQLSVLKQKLAKKNCLALGEIGLDKITKTDFNLQKEVFIAQLEVNKTFKKPVILHCVRAFSELTTITKNYNFPFIIHGFNKKKHLALELINKGFYLSFGKHLLVQKALQQTFKEIPINRIFLETDDANILIESIYKKAAEIREIPLESLILAIENNFEKIFKCNNLG